MNTLKLKFLGECLVAHRKLEGTGYRNPRSFVRLEVFTAVTMKKGVFWDVTPCDSCKNRRFGGIERLLHQGDRNR
jgi:hypothetical protein